KADNFHAKNIRADILFAAFGAPKQEKWIFANSAALQSAGVKTAMGVGGAFDIISGRLPRAPLFLRQIGLEWLRRLILEPARIKRIFNAVILFSLMIIWRKFFYAQNRH
ncbi:MAG: WecB/TagA/CpsF family glycosyltransferase, partial [Patescibacteria group bacterium]